MDNEQRNADHLWHVWINKRQSERGKDQPWEHSLYEFKSMLEFLSYGGKQIADAFEGKLPQTYQQCSRQPVEQLKVLNTLRCSREGIDVTECPILLSLAATFEERKEVLPRTVLYDLMAKTCAWHIYAMAVGIPEGHHFAIDTSMGYLMDETDRMFWDRVLTNMAADPGDL